MRPILKKIHLGFVFFRITKANKRPNYWNPLTLIILFILFLIAGFAGFYRGILDTIDSLKD